MHVCRTHPLRQLFRMLSNPNQCVSGVSNATGKQVIRLQPWQGAGDVQKCCEIPLSTYLLMRG